MQIVNPILSEYIIQFVKINSLLKLIFIAFNISIINTITIQWYTYQP